uniref:Light-independent protochlorophyllide reductase subunit B n=1 Tax=Lacunastrum gracillimum TaxID=427913 RepID=A0A2U8GH39_9CHLO|nr:protochlorophyllide reductase subunit B [Lacunastrum gracillimum]AWI68023.1 protochlorophyllide reductase subunit B [Lacunastrum gracillimum]
MKLAYWMYAGPAHMGTLRVASSFKNVHAIMHAPLGDDYFNVMRSMLERERDFTPVTTSIVDRHVLAQGSQEKVVENITRKDKEENPDLILLTPTCTSSILQEDLQNFVNRASLESNSDVILADVNHYRVNELQAADRTLEQIVRFYIEREKKKELLNNLEQEKLKDNDSLEKIIEKTEKPSVNILGIFTLGFHNQHDCRELKRLFADLNIEVNLVIPEGSSVHELKNLTKAWFNIVPYREVGLMTADFLEKEYQMPFISITPMGIQQTSQFIFQIQQILDTLIFSTFKNKKIKFLKSQNLKTKNKKNITSSLCLDSDLASSLLRFGGDEAKESESASEEARSEKVRTGSSHDFSELKQTLPLSSIPNGVKERDHNAEAKSESEQEPIKRKVNVTISNSEIKVTDLSIIYKEYLNKVFYKNYVQKQTQFISQAAWFSRSIDCQNLTGKRTVVFGDATHAAAMTKILTTEMGLKVVCAGTYCKHDADWFREQVLGYCDQVLITDDHTKVGDMITRLEPAAIFGTQMERHIGKKIEIPCGVISAPVHIQNFPLSYRPFLGYEGTNQIADLVYNSFTLGMEDHLLEIFNGHDTKTQVTSQKGKEVNLNNKLEWSNEALKELSGVPGFVRGKVKKNVENFALENNHSLITLEIMFAAKEAVNA